MKTTSVLAIVALLAVCGGAVNVHVSIADKSIKVP